MCSSGCAKQTKCITKIILQAKIDKFLSEEEEAPKAPEAPKTVESKRQLRRQKV
jgi:hypothetical protein